MAQGRRDALARKRNPAEVTSLFRPDHHLEMESRDAETRDVEARDAREPREPRDAEVRDAAARDTRANHTSHKPIIRLKYRNEQMSIQNKAPPLPICQYVNKSVTKWLTYDQTQRAKEQGYLVCDPGKRNLLYLMDNNGNKLRFSNSQKLTETHQLRFRHRLENYRDRHGISKALATLTRYSSKTCEVDKFKEYLKAKNRVNSQLAEQFHHQIFRKYRWYGYVNRERYYSGLLNQIEETFGKDRLIFYGDYSCNYHMSKTNLWHARSHLLSRYWTQATNRGATYHL